MSGLWKACEVGNLAWVKNHVSGGTDINWVDNYGSSPLMIALGKKHEDIVRFLLTCDGLDCNIVGWGGYTILWLACDNNVSDDIVSTIVGRSLHINTKCGGDTPLHRTLANKPLRTLPPPEYCWAGVILMLMLLIMLAGLYCGVHVTMVLVKTLSPLLFTRLVMILSIRSVITLLLS